MPFQILAKPIGSRCNLDCTYCYYKEKSHLLSAPRRMGDALLERYVCEYLAANDQPEVVFLWQGGEPTLLGIDFFRRVIELQTRHRRPGQRVSNALQTNGTLLDESWARFLAETGTLVGLSVDGPRRLHDTYRRDSLGRGSYDAVLRALELLQEHRVEFNTLTVVHRHNARHGRTVYRYLRGLGVEVMQFIPLVERMREDFSLAGPPPEHPEARVAPWSVQPGGFGTFLCDVFDEWMRRDVGKAFVQLFDIHLGLWAGHPSELCVFAETCGATLAMEHDGSVFTCDHYVYPQYRLGRITETPLAELATSPRQRAFGDAKRDLPPPCRSCRYRFACNGGCPKHRFGPEGVSYLCPSYQRYFSHIAPVMEEMAAHLRQGLPAALVAARRGAAGHR